MNYIVRESAGEHGPGATLCFWGTKLAQASVLGSSGYSIPSLSHADMQYLCICMYVNQLSIFTMSVFPTPITPPRVGQEG